MKTKAKLVLALSVLTAGTAVAGATGTFAWFTTNRSATLTYSKVTAVTSNSKLRVVMGTLTDGTTKTVDNYDSSNKKFKDEITLDSAASYTSDVSSPDGMNFFKPEWKGQAGNNNEVFDVKNVTGKVFANGLTGGYYTQYYFMVQNDGVSPTHVFLNEKTGIFPVEATKSEDKALASWSRVAILDTLLDGDAAPIKDQTTYTNKIIFEAAAAVEFTATKTLAIDAKNPVKTAAEGGAKTINTKMVTTKTTGFATVVSGTNKTDEDGYLCVLAPNAKRYFVVSVWMEGTENDNQDPAINGAIKITLGLSGIEEVGK